MTTTTENEVKNDFEKKSTAKKIPLIVKIIAALAIVDGFFFFLASIATALLSLLMFPSYSTPTVTNSVLTIISLVLATLQAVGFIMLGINLLRENRRNSKIISDILIVVQISAILVSILLAGFDVISLGQVITIALTIALSVYIDPALKDERELQRKLRRMEDKSDYDRGEMAGRDLSGSGYIKLNFFNIFWIFIVCSVIGLILEFLFAIVTRGVIENRAGLLYGPFSPIYGFGAVLMTLALNKFHKSSIFIIFGISAVIGGAFEFATSLYLEFAFGVVAWDYSGTFLSINGRTNFMFMFMWGILGTLWVKFLLPKILYFINRFPWNLRYAVTTICAALMITNGVMTVFSLDCWSSRMSGIAPATPIEQFFADYYDNDFMEQRFQTMTVDPELSSKI